MRPMFPGMHNQIPINPMHMNNMYNPMMSKYMSNSASGVYIGNMPLLSQGNMMNFVNQPAVPHTGEYKKVYVSKIPPGLSDSFMLKLLETCGTVSEWKRMTDQNGRVRSFGLCEYHSVESMLKCLRLLNSLKLEEGYELQVYSIYN
jgi:RNA recognition motif-containing protein